MRQDMFGSEWTLHPACLVRVGAYTLLYEEFIRKEVALEREVEGDLFLHDIGQGFGFRPGSFDGAIRSVFIQQVLC